MIEADLYARLIVGVLLTSVVTALALLFLGDAPWDTLVSLPDDAASRRRLAAWAGLGYYRRARNLIAAARAVAAADGQFPDSEAGLAALPGVGAYTAAAVAAIAFNRRALVLDANVDRAGARLFTGGL